MAKKPPMAGNEHPRFFYPISSATFTYAFSRFLIDYHENIDSFLFLVTLTARADHMRVVAAKGAPRWCETRRGGESSEIHR
jgi:hypothetical protein